MFRNLKAAGNFIAYTVYCLGLGFVCGRVYQAVKHVITEKSEEIKVDG